MAIIYQISLNGDAYDARGKSLEQIYRETGCRPQEGWRDPLLNRPILTGEIGCAISHMRIWQTIADGHTNGIILEEDAIYEAIDPNEVDRLLEQHDSVWLGHRENTMGYWYNAHAYAITPRTARYLLSQGFSNSIVPVDEFLPFALTGGAYGAYRGGSVEKKENYFFMPPIVQQIERKDRPSLIEGTDEVKDMHIHLVTVATDESKANNLLQTAAQFEWPITTLGNDFDWDDPMEGEGGFPKIFLMRRFVENIDPDDIVMFMDGYDTFINDTMETVYERFIGFGADIVFGAEQYLWPEWDYAIEYPESHTKYRFLNSGQYIGRAGAIKEFLEQGDIIQTVDDQGFFHERFLRGNMNVALDRECYIFQNHEPDMERVGDQLFNPHTGCCPCTYHGNGGLYEKAEFHRIFQMMQPAQAYDPATDDTLILEAEALPYNKTLDYEVVGQEVIVTPLFTEEQCKRLIELSNQIGGWQPMEGDKFPAQEIRVHEMGFWDEFEEIWREKLGKIAEQYWQPMEHIGLRDAFTMRYSLDTQTSLPLHTDASLVTGSVKLNNDYEGGDLVFPRQHFSNRIIPVGHCILFPSSVTHGHKVNELISGEKYSLTMWTSRYKGDIN